MENEQREGLEEDGNNCGSKRTEFNNLELCDQFDKMQTDLQGLVALMHMTLEALRSDSVSIDELENAICSLFELSEVVIDKFMGLKNGFLQMCS